MSIPGFTLWGRKISNAQKSDLVNEMLEGDMNAYTITFLDLPLEIIQRIASFLPLSSYASLSITCRGLCQALGNLCWLELSRDPDERSQLLTMIEKDDKRLWLCPRCSSLHSTDMFSTLRPQYDRKCPGFRDGIYFGPGPLLRLSWLHLHLVARQYIHGGQDSLDPTRLSHSQKYVFWLRDKGVTEIALEARVVDCEVLLKCIYLADATISSVDYFISICPHLHTMIDPSPFYPGVSLEAELSCRLSHLRSREKSCIICAPRVRSCKYCFTEYDFTAMETEDGPRLFIEAGYNLGSGQDPDDPRWVLATRYSPKVPSFETGSIQARYESQLSSSLKQDANPSTV